MLSLNWTKPNQLPMKNKKASLIKIYNEIQLNSGVISTGFSPAYKKCKILEILLSTLQ